MSPIEVVPRALSDNHPVILNEELIIRMAQDGHPGSEASVNWGEPDEDGYYMPAVTLHFPIPHSEVSAILSKVRSLMRRLSMDFPEGPVSPEYRDVQMMLHDYEKHGFKIVEDEG